jgi:small subunit ribosomal protein S21
MSKTVNVEVSLSEVRGDVGRLIRKFNKKVKKERILEEFKERMFYEKPSSKRRKEKKRKKEIARKKEIERAEKQKIKY